MEAKNCGDEKRNTIISETAGQLHNDSEHIKILHKLQKEVLTLRKKVAMEAPPMIEQLLEIESVWKRESQFSLRE